MTATSRPVSSRDPVADAAGRRVGVDRQEDERAALRRVRRVDAGGRADEAVPRLGDDERTARADDADGLAQDHLDVPRVRVRACELARPRRRLDVVEPHDAALGLRDDLLREHDDVAVLERMRHASRALRDPRRARPPAGPRAAGSSGSRRPVTRRPACDLVAAVDADEHGRHRLERHAPSAAARRRPRGRATSFCASSSAMPFASASSPQTNASSSGGSPRSLPAASECSPATTGTSTTSARRSASDARLVRAELARTLSTRRLERQRSAPSRASRPPSSARTTSSTPRTASSLAAPPTPSSAAASSARAAVARAEDDLVARGVQPHRERAAERAGAADDRRPSYGHRQRGLGDAAPRFLVLSSACA